MVQSGPMSSHTGMVLRALLVTVFWSSSWVLFKYTRFPPLTFAGVRYFSAAVLLSLLLLKPQEQIRIRRLTPKELGFIALYGLFQVALGNAGQFSAMSYLPLATVSLAIALMPALVAIAGLYLLKERPTLLQWLGLGICLTGVFAFFSGQVSLPAGEQIGLFWALLCLLSYTGSVILGRHIGLGSSVSAIALTTLSMGIGGLALLIAGLVIQGPLYPSLQEWLILGWIVVVSTAVGFTLWNSTLPHLTAIESSVLANLMVVEIAVAAWIFRGEVLTIPKLLGMTLIIAGTLVIQWRNFQKQSAPASVRN